jgi:hypothetical protein
VAPTTSVNGPVTTSAPCSAAVRDLDLIPDVRAIWVRAATGGGERTPGNPSQRCRSSADGLLAADLDGLDRSVVIRQGYEVVAAPGTSAGCLESAQRLTVWSAVPTPAVTRPRRPLTRFAPRPSTELPAYTQ